MNPILLLWYILMENAMGKRVEALYTQNKNASWEDYKKKLRNFSSSIDSDFKEAYRDMTDEVCKNIENGNLKTLNIKKISCPQDYHSRR